MARRNELNGNMNKHTKAIGIIYQLTGGRESKDQNLMSYKQFLEFWSGRCAIRKICSLDSCLTHYQVCYRRFILVLMTRKVLLISDGES